MTSKESFFSRIQESLEYIKNDGDEIGNYVIELRIQMPTGEIETITNPNVMGKIAYIEKAYDDDMHLKTCYDIHIVECTIK